MNKKKIFKRIGVTMLTIATGASIVVGASYITGCSKQNKENIEPKMPVPDERGYYNVKDLEAWGKLDDTYLTQDKIDYLADKIGVDNSYVSEDIYCYRRFKHKNGEPINVYVNDNLADYKQTTLNAVDYFFGLMKDINPLYNYQLTEDESMSDLNIRNEEVTAENGSYDESDGLAEIITREVLLDIPQIEKSDEENKQEYVYYVTLHEILHQFGFNHSISHTAASNTESLMYDTDINHFPLTDYSNLLITYSPNVPESELDNLANTLKEKQKIFANNNKEKYEVIKRHIANKLAKTTSNKEIKADDVKFLKFDEQVKLYLYEDGSDCDQEIQISGDKYKFKSILDNGKTSTCKGDVIRLDNGVIVLKNVYWFNVKTSTYGRYENIYLAKDSTGNYWLDGNVSTDRLIDLEFKKFKRHIADELAISTSNKELKADDVEFLKFDEQVKLSLDQTGDNCDYVIQISGDKYRFTSVLNNSINQEITCKGDVIRLDNGVIILKNVSCNDKYREFHSDLYFVKDSSGNYWLDFNNDISQLTNLELENELWS